MCGGVKNGGLLAKGIADAAFGVVGLGLGIAGLLNDSWTAGLGTGLFLSWIGQGLSEILYGAREFFKAFAQVSATLLFVLDLVKLVVDVGTFVINLANIGNVIRGPGPGLGFLGKLGYLGKAVGSLLTRTAAPTATLMSRAANLINSGLQIGSPQSGVISTFSSDMSNLNSDWGAMQQQ